MNTAASLSAVALVTALGLVGCAPSTAPAPPSASVETSPAPSAGLPAPAPPDPNAPPLPDPAALTDVLTRLADPAVPGAQKITLIENGSADEGAALDRFVAALRDNGSLPLTFDARDLAWSQEPGRLVATVTATPPNPQTVPFTYPMQFVADGPAWKLARQSADQILAFGPTDAPPATGPSPEPPPPAPAPPTPTG
jgi:hypothetical protein